MDKLEKEQITQAFFQILERTSSLEWERPFSDELKPSECKLLGRLFLTLDDGRKTIKTSELSNLLNITPAAVTHLVNPLDEGGYIQRLQDPDDRRVVLIGITDKGKQFARSLIMDANQRLDGLVDYLGEEDSKTFIRLMTSIFEYFITSPAK